MAFATSGPLSIGESFTLATFGSTTFAGSDFTASGLGYAKGSFAINGGALTFTVTSDGSGWLAFNAWAQANGLPPGSDGPSVDFDGDGISNLEEFVLGTDPTAGGPSAISFVKVNDGGVEYPALRFTRRIVRGDVTIEVRSATALDFATTLGSVEVSATPQGDGTEVVVVRSAVPFTQEPRQFLRLFVTLP